MSHRPDLPKALASRIRGAQQRVRDARVRIVTGELSALRAMRRLAEFDNDPQAFAARHYGKLAVASYPVQTTIAREREGLIYNNEREPLRVAALQEAEAALSRIEQQVLAEVRVTRPSAGRVAWPPKLESFDCYRVAFLAGQDQLQQEMADRQTKDATEFASLLAAEQHRFEEDDRAFVEKERARRESLGVEEREREYIQMSRLQAALRSGEITAAGIIDALRRRGSEGLK